MANAIRSPLKRLEDTVYVSVSPANAILTPLMRLEDTVYVSVSPANAIRTPLKRLEDTVYVSAALATFARRWSILRTAEDGRIGCIFAPGGRAFVVSPTQLARGVEGRPSP